MVNIEREIKRVEDGKKLLRKEFLAFLPLLVRLHGLGAGVRGVGHGREVAGVEEVNGSVHDQRYGVIKVG